MFSKIKTDAEVSKFLGLSIIDFINSADSIKILVLSPLGDDTVSIKHLDFPVISISPSIDTNNTTVLHKILKSKLSYGFDDFVKNCTLLPNYSINFFKTKNNYTDTLSILLDFNCDVWYFKHKNVTKSEDNEGARDSLLRWLSLIFPDSNSVINKHDMQKFTYGHLEEKFGFEISRNIMESDSVVVYVLDPQKSSFDSARIFNKFLIIDTPVILENQYVVKLTEIINNKNFYKSSQLAKNCTFLPDIGFRFFRNKNYYTDVLIAFYCDEWLFVSGKNQVYADSRLARQQLIELIRTIRPNDEYFKQLPIISE
jgi:hypothetical protein